jgi:transcriptional regulator
MPTKRQQIAALLENGEMSARDISKAVSVEERLVYEHLAHIKRSLSVRGNTLIVKPYECLVCGYLFKDRKRLQRPGKCPQCKQGHIQGALFHII